MLISRHFHNICKLLILSKLLGKLRTGMSEFNATYVKENLKKKKITIRKTAGRNLC